VLLAVAGCASAVVEAAAVVVVVVVVGGGVSEVVVVSGTAVVVVVVVVLAVELVLVSASDVAEDAGFMHTPSGLSSQQQSSIQVSSLPIQSCVDKSAHSALFPIPFGHCGEYVGAASVVGSAVVGSAVVGSAVAEDAALLQM